MLKQALWSLACGLVVAAIPFVVWTFRDGILTITDYLALPGFFLIYAISGQKPEHHGGMYFPSLFVACAVFYMLFILGCWSLLRHLKARKPTDDRRMRDLARISGWTIGIAAAAFLILDGKSQTPTPVRHTLIGALIGFALGCLFVRQQRGQTARKQQ